jgi:hypothetical protein
MKRSEYPKSIGRKKAFRYDELSFGRVIAEDEFQIST